MKRLIRHGVFETNSSSSHSISIARGAKIYETLPVNEDGYVVATPGMYGWEQRVYGDPQGKLDYAYTFIGEEDNDERKAELFKMLEEVIVEHVGCKGVLYNTIDDKYYAGGYVDHQSAIYEDGDCLRAFASKETLKEFLFNPDSYVETDNDNH